MKSFYKYGFSILLLTIVLIIVVINLSLKNKDEFSLSDFEKNRIERRLKNPNKGDRPLEAIRFDYEQRIKPLGYILENWRAEADKHIEKYNLPNANKNTNFTWTELGPSNIGGRTRSIAINPTNPSIMYAGAVSGGIWKTTNGGSSWFPLKDQMENLAVCSIVLDPRDPNVIYAGTGEGYYNLDAVRGEGIFKSTNGGTSWTQLSATANSTYYYVNDLEFDKNKYWIWAATNFGLFYSTNDGANWMTAPSVPNGSMAQCSDIEIANTNPATIYAAFGIWNQSKICRSTNGGTSFTNLYTNTSGLGRIEMAIAPSNSNYLYAAFMNLTSYDVTKFIKTTDGGASFNNISIPGPSLTYSTYTGPQAWYDNILAVHPTDPNKVLAGGVDLFATTNGGTSWSQKTNWYAYTYPYVHADMHDIKYHPTDPYTFYIATDGGMFKTNNWGLSFTEINTSLSTIQFYYGALHPTSNIFYGGTQDNGNLKSGISNNWSMIISGDGGAFEVDYNTPNTIYCEYVYLDFYKSTNAGLNFYRMMNGIPYDSARGFGTTDRCGFIAPFVMNKSNPLILFAGTYRLYKSINGGGAWSTISSDLTIGSNDYISAIGSSKSNINVIYTGSTYGKMFVTTNGGSNWTDITGPSANYSVKDIEVDLVNPGTVYFTLSGFTTGKKVYYSTNYGQSWNNISGDLPNIPVNTIYVNDDDKNQIFVGTDYGIYRSNNKGTNWVLETGCPRVRVDDLDYRTSDRGLFAFTHGRGLFKTTIPTDVNEINELPKGYTLYQNYPNPFNPSTTINYEIPTSPSIPHLLGDGRRESSVTLKIYDIQGKVVETLVNEPQKAGKYSVEWNASKYSSGVYYYELSVGSYRSVKKMMLMK